MNALRNRKHGSGSSDDLLRGLTVAVQGLGNVASPLIEILMQRGVKRVIATDVSRKACDDATIKFKGQPVSIHLTDPKDETILFANVDIVAPCALGGILNRRTIPQIRAKIVCGAANNQLDTAYDSERLQKRGIWYGPDYLVNRMGIVNCADEFAGRVFDDPSKDPIIKRHFDRKWDNAVFVLMDRVVRESIKTKKTTADIADEMSTHFMTLDNPMFPGRAQQIIDALVADNWDLGSDPKESLVTSSFVL